MKPWNDRRKQAADAVAARLDVAHFIGTALERGCGPREVVRLLADVIDGAADVSRRDSAAIAWHFINMHMLSRRVEAILCEDMRRLPAQVQSRRGDQVIQIGLCLLPPDRVEAAGYIGGKQVCLLCADSLTDEVVGTTLHPQSRLNSRSGGAVVLILRVCEGCQRHFTPPQRIN